MIIWLVFLALIFIFSLLTGILGSQNLFLLLIISWGINFSANEAFLLAFLSGLIFDFILGKKLGEESIKFLLVTFLIFLYKAKFKQEHILFSFTFSFFIICLFNYLNYQNIFLDKAFLWAFLIIPLNAGARLIKEKTKNNPPLGV